MQGQQEQTFTFEQKVNILQYFTLFPALTVMVFLRRKIGYRFLDMLKIQIMVVLLWGYGIFSAIPFGPQAGTIVVLFSLAVLIAAIIERRLRWRDIKRGIRWHTYSRGISWFSYFLPLPEHIVKRFIDPAAVLIPGIALFFLFRPLGFYLILSAVCLFLFETIDFQKQIDRMLDQLDNQVEGEIASENMEYFQNGGAGIRPIEETAGIPTGTDPDLAAAIERRRARSRKTQKTLPAPEPLQGSLSQPEAIASNGATASQQAPAVSLPPSSSADASTQSPSSPLGYPQQEPVTPEPSSNGPRRRVTLPDNLVMTDTSEPQISQAAMPLQAAATQVPQAIPVIQSPADPAFAALPSGAPFMTPDGKTRWKK
ncbi:hypothetical protein EPA93_03925 [Ktedonosporobacter rubrisoli]|uniref:Uncharacterized protein n=1 Tax=Ktedonosporobacter rubrisoli TaxID=2509675 RepID=A0A4P6JJA3_KTERU|nr:hypothetical protein [Ktedonosporobacter rubrisoli]QBD75185.1 hypothetical protein EPA93_03925 [Ktedonosporobacter rubrisoli]